MNWFLAVLAGAVLPLQVGINTNLAKHGAGAIWAAGVSFAVGTVGLFAFFFVADRAPWPNGSEMAGAPWWAWVGGLLGAFYVAAGIWLGPRLGAALLFGLIIGGQLLMALSLDHFGAFGFPAKLVTLERAFGVALIVAGVVLIRR